LNVNIAVHHGRLLTALCELLHIFLQRQMLLLVPFQEPKLLPCLAFKYAFVMFIYGILRVNEMMIGFYAI